MRGWFRLGAEAHTGPATRNAPGGSGATMVDLPVAGSSTPTPWSATYAIKPCVRPPVRGEGEWAGAVVVPEHAARSRAAAEVAAILSIEQPMLSPSVTPMWRASFR